LFFSQRSVPFEISPSVLLSTSLRDLFPPLLFLLFFQVLFANGGLRFPRHSEKRTPQKKQSIYTAPFHSSIQSCLHPFLLENPAGRDRHGLLPRTIPSFLFGRLTPSDYFVKRRVFLSVPVLPLRAQASFSVLRNSDPAKCHGWTTHRSSRAIFVASPLFHCSASPSLPLGLVLLFKSSCPQGRLSFMGRIYSN